MAKKPLFTTRPTKYRAWDGNQMQFVQTLCWSPGGIIWYSGGNSTGWGWINPACDTWTKDNPRPGDADVCPIMQFTGLFDREGREIYEGDIVATSNDDDSDGTDLWKEDDMGYALVGIDDQGINMCENGIRDFGYCWGFTDEDSVHSIKYLKIVGNIFETSDLLKT